MAINLVQCRRNNGDRIVALVDGSKLRVIDGCPTAYALANRAIGKKQSIEQSLESMVSEYTTNTELNYDQVYRGESEWRLMVPFDHPDDPAHCQITGTGLSHLKSADNRNAMHGGAMGGAPVVTDSMRMYQQGVEGGRPKPGKIGIAPEWFWKGNGSILRAHGESLTVPAFAEDGGEEAEVAGVYLIGPKDTVYRVGFTVGNEFSDHLLESKNYLCLAPSKLRECAIGPELVIGGPLQSTRGTVSVIRGENTVWRCPIASGEENMVHSISNLEHHHFKYAQHRRAGDVHIHFFGTPGFSYGAGVMCRDGDKMCIEFEGFGRSLVNTVRVESGPVVASEVTAL